jgi:hypothetical protein
MQDRTTAHDRAAFTMAGEWMVVNTVEETTYPAYKHLRLAFRLVIRQQGETFEAEGEKYLENDQSLPVTARSPIKIQGTLIEGAIIEATFQEAGWARPTHGHFRLTRLSPTQLRGTFASTAAATSGSSQWIRVQ